MFLLCQTPFSTTVILTFCCMITNTFTRSSMAKTSAIVHKMPLVEFQVPLLDLFQDLLLVLVVDQPVAEALVAADIRGVEVE